MIMSVYVIIRYMLLHVILKEIGVDCDNGHIILCNAHAHAYYLSVAELDIDI